MKSPEMFVTVIKNHGGDQRISSSETDTPVHDMLSPVGGGAGVEWAGPERGGTEGGALALTYQQIVNKISLN